MVILDATIVNVALPSIQHGLHFGDRRANCDAVALGAEADMARPSQIGRC
jgi:hypothetical protein